MDPSFLILLAFFGVMYLLMIRPQQKRQREHQQLISSVTVGTDVVTIGGLHGTVTALDEDTIDLTVSADGTLLRFQRSAIAKVVADDEEAAIGDTGEHYEGADGNEPRDVRMTSEGTPDVEDIAATQSSATIDEAAADRNDSPEAVPPHVVASDDTPSALTDPATVINESAESALLRGIDAAEAVREAEAVALDATRRTGAEIDILTALQRDEITSAFLKLADQFLGAQGFTEHGFRHANLVGRIAYNVLHHLGAEQELCDLAAIGGYLHDVGNVVSRMNHGLSSAWIAYDALRRLEVDPYRIGLVLSAVGNHEEQYGSSIGPVGAAVILADKADVHRSRVRKDADTSIDIHDRVNDAVTHSFLRVDAQAATITLELELDNERSTVIEYFEIFLDRMIMCRRAARTLGCEFRITANGVPLG